MKKEVTFEGTPSGDGECFCWDVDLDTYKNFDSQWEEEIKYRQEFNVEQGYPKDQGVYEKFKVYQSTINSLLDLSKKKYKITMIMEEII